VRYDDTLETVLASDLSTPYGKQSAWRQLVDLIGRRRIGADSRALAVLRTIQSEVPPAVRAASARGLEYADPPPPLVRLFARDVISVAAPILRTARLSSGDWILMLAELGPEGRAILRHRRDLSPLVQRALESFGPNDFALHDRRAEVETPSEIPSAEPIQSEAAIPRARAFIPVADEPVETAVAVESPAIAEIEATALEAPEAIGGADEPMAPEAAALGGSEAMATAGEAEETEAVALEAPEDGASAGETGVDAWSPPAIESTHRPAFAMPRGWTLVPNDSMGGSDAARTATAIDDDNRRDDVVRTTEIASADEAEEAGGEDANGVADIAVPDSPSNMPLEIEAVDAPAFDEPAEVLAQLVTADLDVRGESADAASASGNSAAVPATVEFANELPEDLSYVAMALGSAGTFAAARQAAVAANQADTAVQSETVATTAPGEVVAASVSAAQDRDMLERSETLAANSAESLTIEPIDVTGTNLIGETADEDPDGPFLIADVVARIDAFWRNREAVADARRTAPRAEGFRFETDPEGMIRWVEGVSRNPLIGLSFELHGVVGVSRVDGVAAGAFRRRASFTNARMEIEGDSDASGAWLISGVPVFDPANGRFTGYRGTARRPRTDERAEPVRPAPTVAPDSLRQLVHELRTPTNAIAGFAEMIETEMLGPVPDGYRDRAATIRGQARDLLGAIDDLDLAARIESAALSLAPADISLRPLLATICDDLAQLTALRGSWIALPIDNLSVKGDRRAVERLLSRLMATLVSASAEGERIGVRLARENEPMVAISIDRPRALADYPGDSLLGIDDEGDDATLLGTGFALRLARNLARELGGSLVIEVENLTLRLPAPEEMDVEQAHLN
jgi:signal transduction histidine kinase